VDGNWSQKPEFTWRSPGFEQTDDHPVVCVSAADAAAFAAWLSEKDGRAYRLPTEAEWEYACRAGAASKYHFGDDPEQLATHANVADAAAKRLFPGWTALAADDGYVYTAPVGRFARNRFGLHDLHGNVWEWCSDWFGEYPPAATDPTGPADGAMRVIRGGSWFHTAWFARSAERSNSQPAIRSSILGFRLAAGPAGN
jgi:formylglycine-generating enzyme required for sulfatase activity